MQNLKLSITDKTFKILQKNIQNILYVENKPIKIVNRSFSRAKTETNSKENTTKEKNEQKRKLQL